MTLTDFLLARIAEDEALARRPEPGWVEPYDQPLRWSTTVSGDLDMLVVDPARVLAECEAGRRIVALHDESEYCERIALNDALGALALPYAGHPDYREEWRP